MNENQRDHHHARLGEHNGGDYDMRHQTQPCVSQTAESESQPTLTALRETQAALARKDALLRMAMEALDDCGDQLTMIEPSWALTPTVRTAETIVASIEAELSQSPAPVAVQPAALRMLTEDEVETAWNEATRNYRRRSSDSGLKLTHADSEDWHEAIAIQRAFAAANNLGEPT